VCRLIMCFCALDLKQYLFNDIFLHFFVRFVCFIELYFVLMQLNLAVFKGESYLNQTFLNRSSSIHDGKDLSKKRKKNDVHLFEYIVQVCFYLYGTGFL